MANKNVARNNKRTGANFEGSVRKALRESGYFIYTKGVSAKGIDIFALKNNNAIQFELKSHKNFIKSEYNEALNQLNYNYETVNEFIDKTIYKKENVKYCLIYYIRNEKLIIVDIDGSVNEYDKKRNINLLNFLLYCFKENNILK